MVTRGIDFTSRKELRGRILTLRRNRTHLSTLDATFLSATRKGMPHMNLAKELLLQIENPTLTRNEQVLLRCQLAKHLEEVGDYEGARRAVGELWSRVGERPVLDELNRATEAEVLLRVGVLTGWIGSVKQIEGSQETAKNLISESLTIFGALGDAEKVAEAQTDLAYCYWREGALDEARVMLEEAARRRTTANSKLKATILIRRAIVERTANRYNDALRILTEAISSVETSDSDALKGNFHNLLANVLENLSRTEQREDYRDRTFIEYAAASFHFEQAGHTRYHACVENNLGFLFCTVNKFTEAHEHLDRAQALFTTLKDSVHLAQVDETRARVLIAEGRIAEAEKLVRSAVARLEKGGEQSLLAEALTTHGITLARLGKHERSRVALRSAVEIARHAGDNESAGRAALTIVEELDDQLSNDELCAIYGVAAELLAGSQNLSTHKRLGECARKVLFLSHFLPVPPDWTKFSFKEAMRRFEAGLIEKALKDSGGSVTRAARLLGFKHHHSLASIINNRHPNLLSERKPVVHRRRSLFTDHMEEFATGQSDEETSRPITILHVEDNQVVADVVRDALELEGWTVETCADGDEARARLSSAAEYDLLIFDYEVPGTDGVELVKHARRLSHRERTPIIVLSATNCEDEALSAGADEFLRKPREITALAERAARLLGLDADG